MQSDPHGTAHPAPGHGSRLARRRRVLLGVGIAAALLAAGGLIGASFVKSPQQLAADTSAPPPTQTTALVVSQVLTSSVQMRGVVYPATEYDVYPSAPESDSSTSGASGTTGGSAAGGSSAAGGGSSSVYISRLDVSAGDSLTNGRLLAEIDGQPLFALAGPVPAWRDLLPGETGPDVTELQKALARLGYYDDGDTPGYFGGATEEAVSLYYEHLGYIPPSTGGVPMSNVVFLPSLPATVVRGERRHRPAAGPAVPGAGRPRVAGADRRAAARLRGPGAPRPQGEHLRRGDRHPRHRDRGRRGHRDDAGADGGDRGRRGRLGVGGRHGVRRLRVHRIRGRPRARAARAVPAAQAARRRCSSR